MTQSMTSADQIARGLAINIGDCETIEHLQSLCLNEYRGTRWWKRRRALFLSLFREQACACCGQSHTQTRNGNLIPLRFAIHHRNYDHIGAEQDDDLSLVCSRCHWLIHNPGTPTAETWIKTYERLIPTENHGSLARRASLLCPSFTPEAIWE